MTGARLGAAAVLCALVAADASAQAPLEVVVERASAYVVRYQRELAMVVAEERYEQEVRYPSGRVGSRSADTTQTTVLRSDFLLVRMPDGAWLPFRDVFERDRRPVRDREERLSRLFLSDPGTAGAQARRITDESARYNIGNVDRTVNVPTLALTLLTDPLRDGFVFAESGRAGRVRILSYREDRRPTLIRTTGGRNLPISGRFWIDEASGRIERTELLAEDGDIEAKISVFYRDEADAGMWVPVRMEEKYVLKREASEVRGEAGYSRFRRFAVNTREEVATDEVAK